MGAVGLRSLLIACARSHERGPHAKQWAITMAPRRILVNAAATAGRMPAGNRLFSRTIPSRVHPRGRQLRAKPKRHRARLSQHRPLTLLRHNPRALIRTAGSRPTLGLCISVFVSSKHSREWALPSGTFKDVFWARISSGTYPMCRDFAFQLDAAEIAKRLAKSTWYSVPSLRHFASTKKMYRNSGTLAKGVVISMVRRM